MSDLGLLVGSRVVISMACRARRQLVPSAADDGLRRGSAAFLRKDHRAAHQIRGALLRPMTAGAVDLGQDEMVDEVLGTDTIESMAQYVVSGYMISPPAERPRAVHAAIDDVHGIDTSGSPSGQWRP